MTCFLRVICLLALIPLFDCRRTGAQGPALTASIRFHPVDVFGKAVPYTVTVFRHTEEGANKNLAGLFRDMSLSGLRGGPYEYELTPVDARRFSSIRGRIGFLEPEARWLTLLAPPGARGPSISMDMSPEQSGIIIGLRQSRDPAWLRLMWAFDGKTAEEVPVGPEGSFRLFQPHIGRYIITVFQSSDLLYTGVIDLNGPIQSPLRIDASRPTVERLTRSR